GPRDRSPSLRVHPELPPRPARAGPPARANGPGRAVHLPELSHPMKTRYLVCYDIAEHERWQSVYKIMKGAGTKLQYSVFQCDLSDRERELLLTDLSPHIHSEQDQLLVIDLGPCEGRAAHCVRALGRPYKPPEHGPVIV